MESRIYKSAISWGIFGTVGALLFFVLLMMSYSGAWLGVLMIILLGGFIAHILISTDYTIAEGKLHVRCGILFRTSIDIASIQSIKPTSSLFSAPACSLDRLIIRYEKGSIVISPKEKTAFAEHIRHLNPKADVLV